MSNTSLSSKFAEFFLQAATQLGRLRADKQSFIENINYQIPSLITALKKLDPNTQPTSPSNVYLIEVTQLHQLLCSQGHVIDLSLLASRLGAGSTLPIQKYAYSFPLPQKFLNNFSSRLCQFMQINPVYANKKSSSLSLKNQQVSTFLSLLSQDLKFCQWANKTRLDLQLSLLGYRKEEVVEQSTLRLRLKDETSIRTTLQEIFQQIDFFQNGYIDAYALAEFLKYYLRVEVPVSNTKLCLSLIAQSPATIPESISFQQFSKYFLAITEKPTLKKQTATLTSTIALETSHQGHLRINSDQSFRSPTDHPIDFVTPKQATAKPGKYKQTSSVNSQAINNSSQILSMNLTITQGLLSDIHPNQVHYVPQKTEPQVVRSAKEAQVKTPSPFTIPTTTQESKIGISKIKRNNIPKSIVQSSNTHKRLTISASQATEQFQKVFAQCQISTPKLIYRYPQSNTHPLSKKISLQKQKRRDKQLQKHRSMISWEAANGKICKGKTGLESHNSSNTLFQVSHNLSSSPQQLRMFKKYLHDQSQTQQKSQGEKASYLVQSFKNLHPRSKQFLLKKKSLQYPKNRTLDCQDRIIQYAEQHHPVTVVQATEAHRKYQDYIGIKKCLRVRDSVVAQLNKLSKLLEHRQTLVKDICGWEQFNPLNAFNILDTNETGYLSFRQFFGALHQLGVIVPEVDQKIIWLRTSIQSNFSYQSFINLFLLSWNESLYHELVNREPMLANFGGLESWPTQLQFAFIQFMRKILNSLVEEQSAKNRIKTLIHTLEEPSLVFETLFQSEYYPQAVSESYSKKGVSSRLYYQLTGSKKKKLTASRFYQFFS